MRIEVSVIVGANSEARGATVPVEADAIDLPLLLARIHSEGKLDDQLDIEVRLDCRSGLSATEAAMPGLDELVVGAGFEVSHFDSRTDGDHVVASLSAIRLRSLPDYVSANMRMLICGLNPSLNSADLAVGFGRAGNRFWPAALAAGVVGIDRDPIDALVEHRIGMTDLVKRATPRAASLVKDEYTAGLERLERLCAWLRPRVVCMVGLAGWRAAADRKAVAGWQSRSLGESRVYVMPSTSGLNANSSLADLTAHMVEAFNFANRPVS